MQTTFLQDVLCAIPGLLPGVWLQNVLFYFFFGLIPKLLINHEQPHNPVCIPFIQPGPEILIGKKSLEENTD